MNKFLTLLAFLLISLNLSAQQAVDSGVEMADRFRADGKIYVVVAVVLIVLVGLLVYLISLDRKVSKLEKEYGNKKR